MRFSTSSARAGKAALGKRIGLNNKFPGLPSERDSISRIIAPGYQIPGFPQQPLGMLHGRRPYQASWSFWVSTARFPVRKIVHRLSAPKPAGVFDLYSVWADRFIRSHKHGRIPRWMQAFAKASRKPPTSQSLPSTSALHYRRFAQVSSNCGEATLMQAEIGPSHNWRSTNRGCLADFPHRNERRHRLSAWGRTAGVNSAEKPASFTAPSQVILSLVSCFSSVSAPRKTRGSAAGDLR